MSETHCAVSRPRKPNSAVPAYSTGIRKSPCLADETRMAGTVLRIFCRYIFVIMTKPSSGKEKHCHLRISVPILTTSRSSALKIRMISGAKTTPATAMTAQYIVETLTHPQNAFLTLSYSFAP